MKSAVEAGSSAQAIEEALIAKADKPIVKLNSTHSVLTKLYLAELRFNVNTKIKSVKEEFAFRFGSEPKN